MAYIERRQRPFASEAVAVLGKEDVETLGAGAAAVVNGLRPRIVRGQAEAFTEAARELHASGVVVSGVLILDIGENPEVRKRDAGGDGIAWPGPRLIHISKPVEMSALR